MDEFVYIKQHHGIGLHPQVTEIDERATEL